MNQFIQDSVNIKSLNNKDNKVNDDHYLDTIINKSNSYLKEIFSDKEYKKFLKRIDFIYELNDINDIVKQFSDTYFNFLKELHQKKYKINNTKIDNFINKNGSLKLIWGDCYNVLKNMKNESIHLMVTSPPYYNARKYSQWKNLNDYLEDMEKILREC